MNKVGQILLLVGGLVLALLIGVLIGRGHQAQPTSEGNASSVQITTAPQPTPATPAQPAAPLPTVPAAAPPLPAPQTAAIPKVAPDVQVQDDAAAVGMTTREPQAAGGGDQAQPAPKSAASGDEAAPAPAPPNG